MSTIAVDNVKPSAGGTSYSTRGIAKAWVNFNGTGVVAIRDSENVSSITDSGTGLYVANITNDMSTVNYCPVGSGSNSDTEAAEYGARTVTIGNLLVGAYDVTTQIGSGGTAYDFLNMYTSLMGDLA